MTTSKETIPHHFISNLDHWIKLYVQAAQSQAKPEPLQKAVCKPPIKAELKSPVAALEDQAESQQNTRPITQEEELDFIKPGLEMKSITRRKSVRRVRRKRKLKRVVRKRKGKVSKKRRSIGPRRKHTVKNKRKRKTPRKPDIFG